MSLIDTSADPAAAAPRPPAAPRPAVDITDLTVRRGTKLVIDGISTQIAQGSLTALLGPSGCGKTTFLRAIVGVQRIQSGSVTVLGRPAGDAALRRSVGYVTQAPSVYLDLTVRENVRYFASLHGLKAKAGDDALAEVGLTEAAGQLTAQLSGGQRSRVSLACALLGKPDLLVLDEPTVGLDPVIRQELWAPLHRTSPPEAPASWCPPTSWTRQPAATGCSCSATAG